VVAASRKSLNGEAVSVDGDFWDGDLGGGTGAGVIAGRDASIVFTPLTGWTG